MVDFFVPSPHIETLMVCLTAEVDTIDELANGGFSDEPPEISPAFVDPLWWLNPEG
jgi:hypothetical protein